jgi:hypothetical protein
MSSQLPSRSPAMAIHDGQTIRRVVQDNFGLIACAVIVAFIIHTFSSQNLLEVGAFYGFSPAGLADTARLLPFFGSDFPGGEEQLLKSSVMQIYPLIGALGLDANRVLSISIFIEIMLFFVSVAIATRLLRPETDRMAAIATAICLSSSAFANIDIARWGFPYYGNTYHFAYAFALIGAALAVAGRVVPAAACLAITFTIHPVIALIFGVFSGLAILADWRRHTLSSLCVAAALFTLIAGGWMLWTMKGVSFAGGAIPADAFIGLTRMMNYHWYPLSNGAFTTEAGECAVPLSGLAMLIWIYLRGADEVMSARSRQIGIALLGMVLVTLAGIIFSGFSNSPMLVKLALHRAGIVFILIGSMVVIPGLWNDLWSGRSFRALLALAALLLPFFGTRGIPAPLSLAIAGALIATEWRGEANRRSRLVLLLLMALFASYAIWLASIAPGMKVWLSAYIGQIGFSTLFNLKLWVIVALGLVAVRLRMRGVLLGTLLLAVLFWAPTIRSFHSRTTLAKAQDYVEVQNWARQSTPPGTLFMPDPTQSYGWRQLSERPSFGTHREWLQNGFAYDSQADVYREGQRRFAEFGLPLGRYLAMNPTIARTRIENDVRDRYYNAPVEWFAGIAARYGVKFFIFETGKLTELERAPPLPVVYRNSSYLVGIAPSKTIGTVSK